MASRSSLPPDVARNYRIEKEIARGKYGIVYKAESKKDKQLLAIKVMTKRGNKKADVEREVSILKKLKHPGILFFQDFHEAMDQYVLVTELLGGKELFDYVTEMDYLEEKEAKLYLRQLLEGIKYIHSKQIVHLDLKPENLVLKDLKGKELKIIDFGTAQDLSVTPDVKVMLGTPEFISPEVLNYDPVSCASDMWSIGVVAYVLLSGLSPFLGNVDEETVANIIAMEYEWPDESDDCSCFSDQALDFIEKLLLREPRERNTADDCLTHPWLLKRQQLNGDRRISTNRLKAFRARRKWLSTFHAVRASLSLFRLSVKKSSSTAETCEISPSSSYSSTFSPTETCRDDDTFTTEPQQ